MTADGHTDGLVNSLHTIANCWDDGDWAVVDAGMSTRMSKLTGTLRATYSTLLDATLDCTRDSDLEGGREIAQLFGRHTARPSQIVVSAP